MKSLILHPTDMSQWHAIINEAQAATRLVLDENMESYLVFLLMRFSQSTQLMESVMALDFLESVHAPLKRQVQLMRDIGDKSLLFCGLFPGIATKRHVRLQYYSDMGQAAYRVVSELEEPHTSHLFFQLSTQFLSMQQILQALRDDAFQSQNEAATQNKSLS